MLKKNKNLYNGEKKSIITVILLFFILSPLYSQNLIWWFKVQGKNQWLKIGVPYTIYESLGKDNNYLLGDNYPQRDDMEIKFSENVSVSYILKKGMELKVDKIYTGKLIESADNRFKIKIKIYNVSNWTYRVISIESNSISELISKIEFELTNDQVFTSSLMDLRELKYISLSISKFNSERVKILEEGLKQFGKSKTLREMYIKSLLEEEEYDKLVEFLNHPADMSEYRTRIYALMKADDFESAKSMLDKIEHKNYSDYNNLSICYIKTGTLFSIPKELFLKSLEANDKDWRVFYNYSLLEYKNGEFKLSKKNIIKSLSIIFKDFKQLDLLKLIVKKLKPAQFGDFSNIDIFNKLIKPTSYYDTKNKIDYIPILSSQVEINFDRYFLKEGLSFLKKGEYKMAEKLLKRQLYITPFNDELYFYLSYIHQKLGNTNLSLLSIDTAYFIKNRFKYLLYKLFIYTDTNQTDKAMKLYLYLRENFPANTDIEKVYSKEEINWFS
jgi:hypothetical protein